MSGGSQKQARDHTVDLHTDQTALTFLFWDTNEQLTDIIMNDLAAIVDGYVLLGNVLYAVTSKHFSCFSL